MVTKKDSRKLQAPVILKETVPCPVSLHLAPAFAGINRDMTVPGVTQLS
jgi:hypothetical protein